MSWMRRFLLRLYASVRPGLAERRLRREIDAHIGLLQDDFIRRGLSADEARRAARRAFGGIEPAKEQQRDARAFAWLQDARRDISYAVRTLGRAPGFTATALVTLGVGIGLNVSLFTVFNVLALRTWDVRDPASIVVPFARPVGNRPFANVVPLAEFQYVRDRAQTLAWVVAWERGSGPLHHGNGPGSAYLQFLAVSGNFFDVLGIRMAQGRGVTPGDDTWGAPTPIAVLSHRLWQRVFGGDPSVIGRTVHLGVDRIPVTIVGITRARFTGLDHPVDVFVPQSLIDRIDYPPGEQNPIERPVLVAARLKPDVPPARAAAELNTLDRQFRAFHGIDGNGFVLTGTRAIGQPGRTDDYLPLFAILGAALLLVLLLACANVGNLQLARTIARRREIAIRLSLGAGRVRIIRQLLTEALCVALGAGLIGFGLSWIVPRVVLRLGGEEADEFFAFVPDGTVLAFAIGLAVATSILFALAPALQATRPGHRLVLSTRAGIDRRGRRLRALLLASQIALSLTLLTGAGLLSRAIVHVHSADLGFNVRETSSARLTLPEDVRTRADRDALAVNLNAALRASPLWPAGWAYLQPLLDSPFLTSVRRPEQDESWNRRAYDRPMSAASFDVLGLGFVAGGPHSDRPEAREAVLNETLARQLFPGEPAVGRTVLARLPVANATQEPYTITGVVRDSYFTTPTEIVPLFHTAPVLRGTAFLVFRNDRPGADDQIRTLVRNLDPRIQVSITPVASNIEDAIEERRFAAGLAWAIGLLGLALATVGVFGVFAHAVEERRQEIGVRLALGARGRDIVRAMFSLNQWSVGGGVLAGLLLSVIAGFVLRGYLFGLSPIDPVAYLTMTALLVLAATLATILPSRRATCVDPVVTLRAE
jgi:predicted permease